MFFICCRKILIFSFEGEKCGFFLFKRENHGKRQVFPCRLADFQLARNCLGLAGSGERATGGRRHHMHLHVHMHVAIQLCRVVGEAPVT